MNVSKRPMWNAIRAVLFLLVFALKVLGDGFTSGGDVYTFFIFSSLVLVFIPSSAGLWLYLFLYLILYVGLMSSINLSRVEGIHFGDFLLIAITSLLMVFDLLGKWFDQTLKINVDTDQIDREK